MKHLLALSTLTLSVFFASPTLATSSELNIPQVNAVINEVIAESFQADDLVKDVFIKLDEKKTVITDTDLHVAGQAGGTLARTPWDMESATKLKLKVEAEAKDISSNGGLARMGLGLDARTQVLKLASFLAEKILENSSEDVERSDLEKRVIEIISSLKNTESLDQLHSGLVELHQILSQEKPEDFRNVTILAQLVNNSVQSITVRYTHKEDFFFGIHDLKFQLKVTASVAQASVNFKIPFAEDIANTIQEIKEGLLKLQNRNAESIEELKISIQGLRDMLAGLVGDFNS